MVRLLALAALLLSLAAGASAAGPRPVYGVTLDNDAGIAPAALDAQVHALAALPARPAARVVADLETAPGDFALSLPAIHGVADTILELGDSSEVRGVTAARYARWVRGFTARYAGDVDVWEIGNEVNGEWVGTPREETARIAAAAREVHAIGGKTMLTLYYNPDCYEHAANELFAWLRSARLPRSLDYVTVSYYPGDCNGYWPSPARWQQVFDRLHARFPAAKLGFGEAGTSDASLDAAERIELWRRYRAVQVRGDNFVGLGLWWTWAEDAVPASKPFWQAFARSL